MEGTVKFFNSEKGFGFVTPDDASRDIFVHMKALEKSGLGMLEATQRVRLSVKDGEKGPLAEGVEMM
ncbi:MAG: cold shock domain-containing protein [Sneathiella sp.]